MDAKHDGRLGECLRIHYDENLVDAADTSNTATYQGVRILAPYGYMPLTPSAALSLLAWLEQEKSTLERMAKEHNADGSEGSMSIEKYAVDIHGNRVPVPDETLSKIPDTRVDLEQIRAIVREEAYKVVDEELNRLYAMIGRSIS